MSRSSILKTQFNELVTGENAELTLSATTEAANQATLELINSLKNDIDVKNGQVLDLETSLQNWIDCAAALKTETPHTTTWGEFQNTLPQDVFAKFPAIEETSTIEQVIDWLVTQGNEVHKELDDLQAEIAVLEKTVEKMKVNLRTILGGKIFTVPHGL